MLMLMNEHGDAYVDAMLMVNMQSNTRIVTYIYIFERHVMDKIY